MIKSFIKQSLHSLGYEIRALPAPVPIPPPLQLPEVPLTHILDGEMSIFLLKPEGVDGNVSMSELASINALVAKRAPKVLFEIGTFDGRTSVNMIANAPKDALLYTLDLPKADLGKTVLNLDQWETQYVDKEKSGSRFEDTRWKNQIVQLWGDSGSFDFTPYDRKADFIFIDGSHAYDYVKNDTAVALKLASESAILVWHDYNHAWPGVIKALEEFYARETVFQNLKHIAGTSLVFLDVARAAQR